jgi:hypothetical protein
MHRTCMSSPGILASTPDMEEAPYQLRPAEQLALILWTKGRHTTAADERS